MPVVSSQSQLEEGDILIQAYSKNRGWGTLAIIAYNAIAVKHF